jgi:ABC-type Zn uptake system ZnuABC Zn-binding protein ZnuA
MQDARYLRAQAHLCLNIANQLSDPEAAEKMRAQAARYHARAAEIEDPEKPTLSAASKKIEE